jgi:ribonucleoside-diphosphate reductase alpha chain
MQLSENGKLILSRYLLKDKDGRIIERPENLLKRVASNIAKEDSRYGSTKKQIQETEREFFEIMNNLDFMPNLPIIANAGRRLQQLSACFVLPVPDNINGIFQAVKDMALIQKSGGGTGFSFSKLRPEGSYVSETGGIASGPVSFMKVFDTATAAIKEGGIRRGANMGVLRIDHPDIEKFIVCKEKGGLPNFNISIALTEEFMKAVAKDEDFHLVFENKKYKTLKAAELFKAIIKHAWWNGDPGVLFIDKINKFNPTPKIGEIESTNPCGEACLLPYESCILGSINLSNLIRNKKFNFKHLEKIITVAVHFLDNSIDASAHPLPEIENITKANRKIGLGVMGFADALIKMEMPYDSTQAEKFAERVMKFIKEKATKASEELAKTRGAFPNIEFSIYRKSKKPLRNATITTIAPTGTIGIIANCSEGIEPLFNLAFERHSSYGTLQEINPSLAVIAKKYKLSREEVERISRSGTLQNTAQIPDKIKSIFKTAHDISYEAHIKIQAAFQKYTDNAVSKTVNLPEKATLNDVENIFLLAHKLGCKGLTLYRYNSRKEQALEFCKKCEFNI